MIKESVNVVLVSLVFREVSSCESEAENRCMSIYRIDRKKKPGNSLPEKIVPDDKGLKKILPSYFKQCSEEIASTVCMYRQMDVMQCNAKGNYQSA